MLKSLAGCLTELSASDFYWIFFFISTFFDILALLSISRVFSSDFSGRRKSYCLDIPRTIYQMWLYKLNLMCEGLSYQIINTAAVNQAVICYY